MSRFTLAVEKALQQDDVVAVVNALEEKPELIGFMDEDGMTMLHLASGLGSLKCAEALIDRGAEMEAGDGDHKNTPLGWAAFSCNLDMVKLLLERGANTEFRDGYGNSPLDYARQGSQGLLKQWGQMTPEEEYLPLIEVLENSESQK